MPVSSARVGISALEGKPDLSDFGAMLDAAEALGVDTIELPTFDQDVVVGGRILRPQLDRLKALCRGRETTYTVHGPLAINFMDEPWRLQRHFDVLEASVEAAAELGAVHYVMHAGNCPMAQHDGLEAAYARQRHWLQKAGELGAGYGLLICVESLFVDDPARQHTPGPRRLAAELEAVAHPNVRATFDFSHSAINLSYSGGSLVEEAPALARLASHLHIHDSFGRVDDIWMYTTGERVAYGHGDLHLPVGWGDLPWDALMEACVFPPGVIFNIELNPRFWPQAAACVAATRALAARARIAER
ncbi:MAG: sugar phosphate isomerase/epimerase family protein [Alsobacter sp.]